MTPILSVTRLSKSFLDYSSEWKRVFSWFGASVTPKEEHSILKDISFSINSGESVAIVGQNGAGKSTLLKIITRTLKPTFGSIGIHGRVSAILELGMGFHPDLTGRQNIYHSSGLMGFSKEEIDRVIEEIEEFVEIGEYFDQPVRTYSSGMQMRVAFGVATAYRPEILIVDEALSVGDAYFQHKSFARIRDFQEAGTTLLLVSHDSNAIQSICNRAILLEQGTLIKDGDPKDVMDYYNALIAQKENSKLEQKEEQSGTTQTISGTGEVTILSSKLSIDSKEVEYIGVGDRVTLEVVVEVHQDIDELVLGYMIKDRLGQALFGTNTHHLGEPIQDLKAGKSITYLFEFEANIGVGSYSIAVAVHSGHSHVIKNYEWRDNMLLFHVTNSAHSEFIGTTWIPPKLNYSIK